MAAAVDSGSEESGRSRCPLAAVDSVAITFPGVGLRQAMLETFGVRCVCVCVCVCVCGMSCLAREQQCR